jgi:signal transduction histidine kinase/DNA-binding response OmpR family regulator
MSGGSGKVVYSNLRPGDYTFTVKGTNSDGVWNNEETVLNIKVKPPVWATPPLIATYILFILLIVGGAVYYYFNRLKMLSEIKIMRVEKEHSDNLVKARQQFFTAISHEFRAPLSLIIGPVEKLLQNEDLNQLSKKYIHLIEKNARRLLWLNNQLLDFRQIESKSMKMNISEFDIVEFTRNIYWLFTDKAERKNIDYSFEPKVETLVVQMDLRKIETILFNLLSNAFKFTNENGTIQVSIDTHKTNSTDDSENKICIKVKDTGIGISVEDQNQVFNRFFQAEEALKMERGSGIGLTLVNEYVKMHDGEIGLQSQKGKGTEFNIILPLKKYYPENEPKETEKDQIETILKPETENTDSESSTMNYSTSGNPVILLVEDDKEITDFILMSFREKFNVMVAKNGVEAFQKISEKSPDLVISDVIMPEMDGIEFTKKFKTNPKTSHIPLILLTGQSGTEKQMEGLKSGADAYILKPFEIDLLEVRIENFLKRREQLLEYLKIDKITKPKNIELASNDEKILKQVVNCIENHISDPDLDISKLCKETGFSHSSLYRKIKSLTGQTTKEFIRTVRLRRAEQLLKTKKFTVSEIMDQTGFTNHSYFSKCFRKVYKLSPKDYIVKK